MDISTNARRSETSSLSSGRFHSYSGYILGFMGRRCDVLWSNKCSEMPYAKLNSIHMLCSTLRDNGGTTVTDTHQFHFDARIYIASHARKCAEIRTLASYARKYPHMRAYASRSCVCEHNERRRRANNVCERGHDASFWVLEPEP